MKDLLIMLSSCDWNYNHNFSYHFKYDMCSLIALQDWN